MEKLVCPHCGQEFMVDESGYAELMKQVRDEAFEKDLKQRLDAELARQKAEQKLVSETALAAKSARIMALEAELKTAKSEQKAAVATAVQSVKDELRESESKREVDKMQYEAALRLKDEEIDRIKEFKARQSTKMIGESLEHHCEDMFNQVRAMAFPRAYFEKDNAVSAATGSKGDFIYRDYDESGMEIVSVMLEMKNELDTTATKHRNVDFLKELDKDRREKGCEYAVLVTLLEADSELYNQGIVDVSHKYPKMYVIRPQFMLAMLSLLRQAGMAAIESKRELQAVKMRDVDITKFGEALDAFKADFGRNVRLAGEKFDTAIQEIDKAIDHLTKMKAALVGSSKQLAIAGRKADDLTMSKLTKDSPSLQ